MPAIEDLVTEEMVEQFRRDGAIIVRGLFTPEEVKLIEIGIEKILADPSPMFLVASRPNDPAGSKAFVEDFCNIARIPEYKKIVFESRAADVAKKLTGAKTLRFNHDHTLVKEPGTTASTPWHQDIPYYNLDLPADSTHDISLWAPVDHVPLVSTLEFLAGTHKQGWFLPRTFEKKEAKWFAPGTMPEVPDIEEDRAKYDKELAAGAELDHPLLILRWEVNPGDAIFFSMRALHHSYGVPGKERRRAFSLRFTGEDVRHAPRPWRTSPQFDGLDKELAAGAELDHPLFPILRSD